MVERQNDGFLEYITRTAILFAGIFLMTPELENKTAEFIKDMACIGTFLSGMTYCLYKSYKRSHSYLRNS